VDEKVARHCVEANRHSSLSAFYYLLLKKKTLEGMLIDEAKANMGYAIVFNSRENT
jgi:hypothetical protein